MIGATRETVTTVINRFRDEGLTTVEQRILVILKHAQLQAIAQHGVHNSH